MKIKAKKTNSASENAIRFSYFVIQSRKVMHLSRSTCQWSEWLSVPFKIRRVDSGKFGPIISVTSDLACWAKQRIAPHYIVG